MLKLSVLGSTGSVGSQTLEVLRMYKHKVSVKLLGASKPSDKLKDQVLEFKPEYVYIEKFDSREFYGSKVINGDSIEKLLEVESDLFINAVSGISGIKPTYLLLKAGKKLATANKESIVCLGEILKDELRRVVPIDSEHSAIYQIISSEKGNPINRIVLTASGGPFLHWKKEELEDVSVDEALNHPKWSMGKKITVDSATLLNKGLEVIEAHYLFGFEYDKIDVVVHPESIIHGMVEFVDGTFIANMSHPDMRIPISYAIFGGREKLEIKPLNLVKLGSLSFYRPDFEKFPLLKLAIECGKRGSIYPVVLTVADEIAVDKFLSGNIKFTQIHSFIEDVVSSVDFPEPKDLLDLFQLIEEIYHKFRH